MTNQQILTSIFSMPESMSVFPPILSPYPLASSTSIWMELVSESLLCGGRLCRELDGRLISIGLLGTWKTPSNLSWKLSLSTVNSSVTFWSSFGVTGLLFFNSEHFSLIGVLFVSRSNGFCDFAMLTGDWDIGVNGGETVLFGDSFSVAARRAKRLLRI